MTEATAPVCFKRSGSVPADETLLVQLGCTEDVAFATEDAPPAGEDTPGPIDRQDGTVCFTPAPGFHGTTSFTYVSTAGGETSAPATLEITITERGFAPQVSMSASTHQPRVGAQVTFQAFALDPDGGEIDGYEWFVDGDPVGDGTGELVNSFATAGPHTVRVVATDDEGDSAGARSPSTRTRTTSGPVPGSRRARDGRHRRADRPGRVRVHPDGEVASYEWDFGDESETESGVDFDHVEHALDEAGTYTVTVTVTDDAGATATATAHITVTDEDTLPTVTVHWWPNPAVVGQAVNLVADASDAEGDAIVSYEWDLDGDHAAITGPRVLDTGTTGTYRDGSTDDGEIASRGWDTDADGAFDDGTGVTVNVPAGGTPRFKTLRLRVTDDEGETSIATRQITVRTPGPLVIEDPVPPPLPGGGTVSIGTVTDPATGQTTITIPVGQTTL